MQVFLTAVLDTGETVTAEFNKLDKIQRYIAQVLSGEKPFNVFAVQSQTLPSGEPLASRTRRSINGKHIVSLTQTNSGGTPIAEMPRGSRGRWTVPTNSQIEGLVPGTVYPKHREQRSLRDYVIVQYGNATTGQKRYYIGDVGITELLPEPGDADDDIGAADLERPLGAGR
jgi:hypothetical protein